MYDPSSPLLRPAITTDGPPAPDAKARFAEDRLLDAVIWCEVQPGETLTEADVMERFGLTRAAARAGLTRLGYDGWAMPQPRTGWLVLPVTGALIGHVLDARRIAEPALADIKLTDEARRELEQIALVLQTLDNRPETGATISVNHYLDRIDGLLLGALNPFTARHLRKLWHHSARILRFLEDFDQDRVFRRLEVTALIEAVLAGNGKAIVDARMALIDAQEVFCLRQLLRSDAPLTPGSGVLKRAKTKNAAINRSKT
jgi:DNA-binding GntR family transcriptional regulator